MFDWMKWQDLLHFLTPAQLSAGSGRRNLSQAARTKKALVTYVIFFNPKLQMQMAVLIATKSLKSCLDVIDQAITQKPRLNRVQSI